MSRPRRPIFIGAFIGEKPKRGRPTDTQFGMQLEWRQNCAVREMIGLRLLGESLNAAIAITAELLLESGQWKCEEDALRDLYRANVRDAINEVASDLVLHKLMSAADALARVEIVIAEMERRSAAQR